MLNATFCPSSAGRYSTVTKVPVVTWPFNCVFLPTTKFIICLSFPSTRNANVVPEFPIDATLPATLFVVGSACFAESDCLKFGWARAATLSESKAAREAQQRSFRIIRTPPRQVWADRNFEHIAVRTDY